jgi:hypothetical protein
MFGMFKKEIGWQDIEFVFLVSAAEMSKRLSSGLNADSIMGKINETLRIGKIKLSPSQERAVTSACAVMALSTELRNSLKKITNNDGTINEFEFSKLVKELPSHGIFFRDTASMADIHKSLFGG